MLIQLDQRNYPEIIDKVSKSVLRGGIAILPFDTVYGIICDPSNEKAVRKIFALKERPLSQAIGLATYSIDKISDIEKVNDYQHALLEQNTPGKVSFILKASQAERFSKFCIKDNTILIRVPDSKIVCDLAHKVGGYLAQTSANKNGQPFCKNITEMRAQFGDKLEEFDYVIDGGSIEEARPSTIIDLTTPLETIVRD